MSIFIVKRHLKSLSLPNTSSLARAPANLQGFIRIDLSVLENHSISVQWLTNRLFASDRILQFFRCSKTTKRLKQVSCTFP